MDIPTFMLGSPAQVLVSKDTDPTSFDHPVTQRHLAQLTQETNTKRQALKVIALPTPDHLRQTHLNDEFAAAYAGFYVCNGAVLMQHFGDDTLDRSTQARLEEQFPGRDVISLNIGAIAAGGGSIHCATMQEPA